MGFVTGSMGTFYQQHDDEIGADTMVVVAATAAAAAEGDYAAQQLLSERQSSKQELMAYRSLCSEIYATERSPHRSQFQRENHILAERQRREEMNEKFSALRAMIPKATKVRWWVGISLYFLSSQIHSWNGTAEATKPQEAQQSVG
jgi:hypothetical protein